MSNASGQVAAGNIYTYSAYGEPNTLAGFPYRYTGRRLDAETGLYYYRARYYDSALGRFLQTDPIGYKDQMNLYAYVGSDPVNNLDPSGLSCAGRCGEQDNWKNGLSSNWMSYLPRENSSNGNSNSNASSKTPKVIDSNSSAVSHYYHGNGESVVLGKNTIKALLSHPVQVEKAKRISAGLSSLRSGNYQVDLTKKMFHVGRTRVEYTQECGSGVCSTAFRAFVNDGFWDANIAAPWSHDGPGSGGELGGTVYSYEVYEWLDIYVSPYTK